MDPSLRGTKQSPIYRVALQIRSV